VLPIAVLLGENGLEKQGQGLVRLRGKDRSSSASAA